jgi:hypothetical protein
MSFIFYSVTFLLPSDSLNPGVSVVKLLSSSLTLVHNKLECLSLAFFQGSRMILNEANADQYIYIYIYIGAPYGP